MPTKILLSSVFKPFGVDDVYSRRDSRIELYHNQLTKYQGIFSMRDFMNSFGIHAIANNIKTPSTVLDFPTLDRFKKEVAKKYDIVGISAILPNFQKARRMVEETRRISPGSKIVVGGFCATLPDIRRYMDVDYVCIGDGISFMRDLLGEPADFVFKNPPVFAESKEILGVPIFGIKNPHIVVGLGCSYGCDFCSPSHFFGRRHIRFYEHGRELFEEMVATQERFGKKLICFIGDDNFLLDMKRAEELRQRVVDSGRIFEIMIFGSSDLVRRFGPESLAEMGVSVVWIGREGKFSGYNKNRGVDLKALIAELRSFGIKTILSSILLLDQHTKENIMQDVDEHIDCQPVFSQFSHYAPVPGTPFWDRMKKEKRLLTAIPFEDCHAFDKPWFIHPEFNLTTAREIQDQAYLRDFHELGPSLVRYIATDLAGCLAMRESDKPHLRARADHIAGKMWVYRTLLLGVERLAPTDKIKSLTVETRRMIEKEFGEARLLERAAGLGLMLTGRFREFRTRFFGDALQPKTRVSKYPGDYRT